MAPPPSALTALTEPPQRVSSWPGQGRSLKARPAREETDKFGRVQTVNRLSRDAISEVTTRPRLGRAAGHAGELGRSGGKRLRGAPRRPAGREQDGRCPAAARPPPGPGRVVRDTRQQFGRPQLSPERSKCETTPLDLGSPQPLAVPAAPGPGRTQPRFLGKVLVCVFDGVLLLTERTPASQRFFGSPRALVRRPSLMPFLREVAAVLAPRSG